MIGSDEVERRRWLPRGTPSSINTPRGSYRVPAREPIERPQEAPPKKYVFSSLRGGVIVQCLCGPQEGGVDGLERVG